jgi:hypothetical protein
MNARIYKWLNYNFPQNYIVQNPLKGTLIITMFDLAFMLLYKPFHTHASGPFSFETTMALYGFLSAIFIFMALRILKIVTFFSIAKDWTILKEFLSVLFILFVMGIALYIIGFFIEGPDKRLNIITLMSSLKFGFLIGMIPLTFFTSINYRNFFSPVLSSGNQNASTIPEDLIRISSTLKKEELSFYPSEFLYAESDGNYVVFYLNKNNLHRKEIIRNSINNIEHQLSQVPYFFRTHRAFIVNLKKVRSKQGNTLGYIIKLTGIDVKIPVSRKNTNNFNRIFAGYHA